VVPGPDVSGPEADVYRGLRQQVLHLTADQLGEAAADATLLALLMETGYPQAVATLVAVVDGTTSLYFSNGGGILGSGADSDVADASRRWLQAGLQFLDQLEPVSDDPPLPSLGATQFVAVTPDGLRTAGASEDELGEGEHPLSPLFYAGHEVIGRVRLVSERKQS
jgi:hypothetical protein